MAEVGIITNVNLLLIGSIIMIIVAAILIPELLLFSISSFAITYILGYILNNNANPEIALYVSSIVLIATTIIKAYFKIKLTNSLEVMEIMQEITNTNELSKENNIRGD